MFSALALFRIPFTILTYISACPFELLIYGEEVACFNPHVLAIFFNSADEQPPLSELTFSGKSKYNRLGVVFLHKFKTNWNKCFLSSQDVLLPR